MTKIYVLARNGQDYGNYEMVGWFADESSAEAEALRREWADYEVERAKGNSYGRRLSPDETDYRRYWVEELNQL